MSVPISIDRQMGRQMNTSRYTGSTMEVACLYHGAQRHSMRTGSLLHAETTMRDHDKTNTRPPQLDHSYLFRITNGKDDRIEQLELLDVVWRKVPEDYSAAQTDPPYNTHHVCVCQQCKARNALHCTCAMRLQHTHNTCHDNGDTDACSDPWVPSARP